MSRAVRILVVCLLIVPASAGTALVLRAPAPRQSEPRTLDDALGDLPLSFIENRGQVDPRAAYYLRGAGASVYFTPEGLALSVAPEGRSRPAELAVEFPGADPVTPVARGRTSAVVSPFSTGSGSGVPTFSEVAYRDLWPGIDLVYSGTGSQLKYRFEVAPGFDPGQVGMAWGGATDLAVNGSGQLEVVTPSGVLIDDTPHSYQVIGDARVEIPTEYAVSGRSVGLELGSYDPSRPLVIDPALLLYAGYIGGSGSSDEGRGVAVDASGNAYVAGRTDSDQTTFPDGDPDTNDAFPVPGADQTYNGSTDAFVAKVNAAGTALVYATYIGGAGDDQGRSVAVDSTGAAYVTGSTGSDETTFPDGDGFGTVPGFDQTSNGNGDAFVVKLNPAGISLVYATYLGGSDFERAQVVRVDVSGNAYVTGRTGSTESTFPDGDGFGTIPGPDKTINGGTDAFVAKVNAAGTGLAYAGYIGGSATDNGFGIVPDPSGAAVVVGWTDSTETTFPDGDGFGTVPGPDQTQNGNSDAFMARVNAAGTALLSAGYIGGAGYDWAFGVAVDASGAAYVTGETPSTETTFPDGDGFGTLPGPDQSFNGLGDAFVAKVNQAGTALVYAGYVGGASFESGFGIAADPSGHAYVVGETDSDETTFPDGDGFGTVPGPDQTQNGNIDAFVVKVTADGTGLVYGGFIGGSGSDSGYEISVDAGENAYVAGRTASDETSFPDGDGIGTLPGPDQTFNGGVTDAFVAKIEAFPPVPAPAPSPSASCKGKAATLVGTKGKDVLVGTPQADVVAALAGNDTIKTRGGKDLVCAGKGRDSANGGGGKDKLRGEAGKDRLKGAGGNDKLNGGKGRDTCVGGSGRDKALGCEVEKGIP